MGFCIIEIIKSNGPIIKKALEVSGMLVVSSVVAKMSYRTLSDVSTDLFLENGLIALGCNKIANWISELEALPNIVRIIFSTTGYSFLASGVFNIAVSLYKKYA